MCVFVRTSNAFYFPGTLPADSAVSASQHLAQGIEGPLDPKAYILGPGDRILIVITGMEEIPYHLTVDLEGNIYIPRCGLVKVAGETFAGSKELIRRTVQKFFKNVEIFVTLTDFRWIKVNIQGMVVRPGPAVVQSNTRLSDLLVLAGGFAPKSNSRMIRILHRTGQESVHDLLQYNRLGDLTENPFLMEGDFVTVGVRDRIISIDGAVAYPGTYDLRDGERADDFIRICGGLLETARRDSIELIRYGGDKRKLESSYFSFSSLASAPVELRSHDRIVVRTVPLMYPENLVFIQGHVKFPGPYKIIEGETTLSMVMREAGGFLSTASLADAMLIRQVDKVDYDPEYERIKSLLRVDMTDDEYDYMKSKARSRPGYFVVDFVSLFTQNAAKEDVKLRNNDIIVVPEKVNYVSIIGQVVTPGKITFHSSYKVLDYIRSAGGFAWRAKEADVRVVKGNTGEWIEAGDVDSLQAGDVIWVPEEPPPPRFWDVVTKALNIVGQVATVVAATVAVVVATR